MNETEVKLYKSTIWTNEVPMGDQVTVDTLQIPAIIHNDGLLICCNDGLKVNIILLSILFTISQNILWQYYVLYDVIKL